MRILLILLLLLANLMLFGANHQMFGPLPAAGLRNPAPLNRELNPANLQVRPMAPGEYVDHPVVGPADPTIKMRQADLQPGAEAPAEASGTNSGAASGATAEHPASAAGPASMAAASGTAAADQPSSAAAAVAALPASNPAPKHHRPRHKHN